MEENKIENLEENQDEQQIQGEETRQDQGEVDTGEQSTSGDGLSEQEGEQTKDPSDTESESDEITIDGLEIPEPDLEKKTREDYIQERLERKREREEKRERELKQEQIKRDHAEIVRIKAEQAELQASMNAPNKDDFGTETEYLEAAFNYTLAKKQIKNRVMEDERAKFAAHQRFMEQVEETKNKGASKYSDFEEVIEPLFDERGTIPPNLALVDAINSSPYGSDILYLLGKNKEKAMEVAKMHPRDAMKWVWQTEQKYDQVRSKSKQAQPTNQVKVMPKVNSKLAPHKDIGSMTTKEYAEWWKKTRFSN